MVEFQDPWQVGGKEIFEQVRILPTISHIPTLVPGDSASLSQVQLCREALPETSGPLGQRHLKTKWFDIKVLWFFNIEILWCRPKTLLVILFKTYINSEFQCSFSSKLLHSWPLNKARGRATCMQLKILTQRSWPSLEVDSKLRWRIRFSNWG